MNYYDFMRWTVMWFSNVKQVQKVSIYYCSHSLLSSPYFRLVIDVTLDLLTNLVVVILAPFIAIYLSARPLRAHLQTTVTKLSYTESKPKRICRHNQVQSVRIIRQGIVLYIPVVQNIDPLENMPRNIGLLNHAAWTYTSLVHQLVHL